MTLAHSPNSTTSPGALATLPPESTASAPVASVGSMLDAALSYAAQGFEVFPLHWPLATGEHAACSCRKPDCTKIGKHPLWELAPNGSTDATTDATKIRAWWGACPSANIGTTLEGLVAVDVDPRHGGADSIKRFWREHPLPATRTIDTGSGGVHLIFRGTPDKAYKGKIGDAGDFPGIDIKAGGGAYLVAAPSLHASGKRYWISGAHEIAPLPAILEMILSKAANSTEPSPVFCVPMPDTVARERIPQIIATVAQHYVEGRKHDIALSLSGYLFKQGWSQDQIVDVVRALPSADPEGRVKDALDATSMGENAAGFQMLSRSIPAQAMAQLEILSANPAQAAALAPLVEAIERRIAAAAASSIPAPIAVALDNDPFKFMWSDGIFAPLEPPVYVIDQLVQRGSLVELIAYGASGKTWLIVEMGVSASLGRPTFGRFPSRPSRVKFIDFENGTDEMRRRIQAVAKAHGASTIQNLAVSSFPRIYLTDPRFESLLLPVAAQSDVIFIDTFKAASPGVDENDSNIRVGLDVLKRIASQTKCAIVVLAHAKKTGAGKDDFDPRELARGSSAIFDAADTVFAVQYKEGEPLSVVQTKARLGRTAEPFLVTIEDLPGPTGLIGAGGVRVGGLERGDHAAAALSANERRILDKLKEAGHFDSFGTEKALTARGRLRKACGMKDAAFAAAYDSLLERSCAHPETEGVDDNGQGRARRVVYRAPGGQRLSPSAIEALQREP